mgnify:CR=1 FL=1
MYLPGTILMWTAFLMGLASTVGFALQTAGKPQCLGSMLITVSSPKRSNMDGLCSSFLIFRQYRALILTLTNGRCILMTRL